MRRLTVVLALAATPGIAEDVFPATLTGHALIPAMTLIAPPPLRRSMRKSAENSPAPPEMMWSAASWATPVDNTATATPAFLCLSPASRCKGFPAMR